MPLDTSLRMALSLLRPVVGPMLTYSKNLPYSSFTVLPIKYVYLATQFHIQLVFKAPLCITLTISDQKIVSGSLFFQLFEGKKKKKL